MKTARRPDGCLTVVTGSSRQGKTYWTVQQIKTAPRLLVWDVMGEFSALGLCKRITSAHELAAVINDQPGRYGFMAAPTAANFDTFCRLAWLWIHCAPGALVIEELADVTTPGKAPEAWGQIVRKGLRFGVYIYALTQRPSESDKTIMGNATVFHTHAMARAQDRRYMAAEMDIEQSRMDQLLQYEFIERDMRTREIRQGGGQNSRRTARTASKKPARKA